ncbi:DUF6531 domain-containing protein [Amycolatopsis nigrescens]|uniref:DUF6531 domain-containing protein n=1 Tax=Amycolatopsis nigrescens TaxID=381445 RepID=UPI000378D502|nr:DUF6531 domain-containing protein [Amycolatopsis nigrescens]
MGSYADAQDPIALLGRTPAATGPTVEDAVREAGFEVQAVDWVWQQVVGESLVDSIIKPITGDFEKISQQAAQWENVCDALQAIRNNLNTGLQELGPAWQGDAAQAFEGLIAKEWTVGIEVDAQAAKLIGMALNKVAEGSKRACDQALNLIKKLVDKLIEAAAMLPIPVVGWGRAVKLVYDGIQIYNAIMQLIEGIKAIIEGAQQVVQGIQKVGSALSKIKDVRSLNDAINVANEAGEGAAQTKGGVDSVRDGAGAVRDGATSASSAAHSAHDNATGLRDERAAARDTTPSSSGDGSTDPGANSGRAGDTNGAGPARTDQDGSLRDNASEPKDTAQEPVGRCGRKEPIDAATGEMFMVQTDVDLPGLLPLVLKRVHVSSYRAGRLFGPSWASTLDQRLEFDERGVCYAGPAGVILVYPTPAEDGDVLPAEGARWPLARTGEGGYTITQPETGHTLHFPPATAGTAPITAVTDRNGHRIDFEHDDTGTVTGVRHSGGYHVGVDTENGLVTSLRLRQPAAEDITLVRFGYQDRRLTAVTNSSGQPLRFHYDHAGRITRWDDRNGEWYGYQYDHTGRCVRTEGSGNVLTGTFEYDPDNRVTVETDSFGHVTTHHFDELHQLIRQVDPLGNETRYEWDGHDRLVAETDALGRTTRYDYDEAGNLTVITRPDGSQSLAECNDLRLPVSTIDPDGSRWRREYDERGNLLALTNPAGATTRYTYDERGHLSSVTDALGHIRRVTTNEAGLPVAVTDPAGATSRYQRDRFGRVVTITDAMGGTTRLMWTIEGKLLSRTLPDGATERWSYDGQGNQVDHMAPHGALTRIETTHFDLPAAHTRPDGTRLEYSYDTELRLVGVRNQQGREWRYEYDAAGNLVGETDFNGRTIRYRNDAAGQLLERVNGLGEVTRFTRDTLGNIVERRSGDTVAGFEYDPAGRLLRAVNADADVRFQRDALGRVLSETLNGRRITSRYDELGRRTERRTPTGSVSNWEYDADRRPTAIHTGGRTLTFGYDQAGRETERVLDTGALLAQTWDANHRLTGQTLSAIAGAPGTGPARTVQQRRYHYQASGQLTAIEDDLAGPRRYDLDQTGRVTGVNGPGWSERYAYDAAGNLTMAEWPSRDGDELGPREHTGTLVQRAGNVRYQHDRQGRVVLRQKKRLSAKPDTWHYVWDADDRLVEVVTPDGTRWRYRYDAIGRRIAKQRVAPDGSVAEQVDFAWDGSVLAEQTHDGTRSTTWNYQPNSARPVTQVERGRRPDAPQEWVDQRFYSIVTDLIGTPTELVDPAGEVAWKSQTTLWGRALTELTATAGTPLRFPGQYHDPESGFHYNYYRHYDPATGHYASSDPLGLAPGPNPHAYVANPLRQLDALGLDCGDADPDPEPEFPAYLNQNHNGVGGHGIYHGIVDGEPNYVGISNDIERRGGEHGERFERLEQLNTQDMTRGQARAIEQSYISDHPEWENARNEIAPHRDIHDPAVEWGRWWRRQNGLE